MDPISFTDYVLRRSEQAYKPPPLPVGHFEIAQFMYVAAPRKPNAFHRWCMRAFMGWRWHDGHVVKPSHPMQNFVIGYGLEYNPSDAQPTPATPST